MVQEVTETLLLIQMEELVMVQVQFKEDPVEDRRIYC